MSPSKTTDSPVSPITLPVTFPVTTGFNPEYAEQAPSVAQLGEFHGDLLLEFGAPWCGHCKAAHRAVKEALAQQTELPHIKVYDGKGKRLGRAFKVKLWPTLILLRDGAEVARLVRPVTASEVSALLSANR